MVERDIREVKGGELVQGVDEEIVYTVTTTPWGSSPTNVAVTVLDLSDDSNDVTATVTSGASSVSGDVITLPKLLSLTVDHRYKVQVEFTSGNSVFVAYLIVVAE